MSIAIIYGAIQLSNTTRHMNFNKTHILHEENVIPFLFRKTDCAYRLADMVRAKVFRDGTTGKRCHFKNYPNSLASIYMKQTNGDKTETKERERKMHLCAFQFFCLLAGERVEGTISSLFIHFSFVPIWKHQFWSTLIHSKWENFRNGQGKTSPKNGFNHPFENCKTKKKINEFFYIRRNRHGIELKRSTLLCIFCFQFCGKIGDVIDKRPESVKEFLNAPSPGVPYSNGANYARSLKYYELIWSILIKWHISKKEGFAKNHQLDIMRLSTGSAPPFFSKWDAPHFAQAIFAPVLILIRAKCKYEIERVVLVGGYHFLKLAPKSEQYVDEIIKFWRSKGYEVLDRPRPGVGMRIASKLADDDFIFMANSFYFVESGGGFSRYTGQLVRMKGRIGLNVESVNSTECHYNISDDTLS